MRLYGGFSFKRAEKEYGWALGVLGIVLSIFSLFLYKTIGEPIGTAPLTTTEHIVPASGVEGFPVEPFCKDSKTFVTKMPFVPPDSDFSAVYVLNRTRDNIHEVVTVKTYADTNRQPIGLYNDDLHPAFVNKDAMKCILDKV